MEKVLGCGLYYPGFSDGKIASFRGSVLSRHDFRLNRLRSLSDRRGGVRLWVGLEKLMVLNKLVAVSSVLAAVGVAHADIIFFSGPGNFPGDENILFNEPGLVNQGNPVEGLTNNTGFIVAFLSDETLDTPAGGQARVAALDGSFDDLSIFLDNNPIAGYTSLILNINALADGFVNFTVDQLVGPDVNASFALTGGGQNFFRIQAINGQYILNTSFTTTVGVEDVRQVRIGGSTTDFNPDGEPVPEPATMLLGGGALGVAFLRKRAAKKAEAR